MPLTLQWGDIALRLVLTIIAGTLVGIDRSERGQAAGLRTTILVCLAAAVAMIQMNLLMPTAGTNPRVVRHPRPHATAARHSHGHGVHRRRCDPASRQDGPGRHHRCDALARHRDRTLLGGWAACSRHDDAGNNPSCPLGTEAAWKASSVRNAMRRSV